MAREKLLAAGTELIAERGLDGVNTNVIAQTAGMGVGSFYAHFDDKFSFHYEIVASGLVVLQRELAAASSNSTDLPLQEQVRASVTAFVAAAERKPLLFRVTLGAASTSPGRGRGTIGLSPRAMEKGLRDLQANGLLEPTLNVAVAARAFLAGQRHVVLGWLEAPDPIPSADLIETLTRLHPAMAGRL